MKHLIRFAILACVVIAMLAALSLRTTQTKANVNVPFSGGECAPCDYLTGVAVVSTGDVWAVGYHHNSDGTGGTLIEHWNGTQWSVVSSPNNVGSEFNDLYGVATISATDAWAVGHYFNSDGTSGTLIERWNGSQWSVIPSGPSTGSLFGVTAVSATNDWTVGGSYQSGTTADATLSERWNGNKWNVVKSPGPKAESFLYGVAVVSATDVWAVGVYYSIQSFGGTLIEQWNGTQWSVVPSRNPSASTNNLFGVAAVSATDVWAVGNYYKSSRGANATLIEQWNGTQWSLVKSPNVGTGENDLHSVAAISATDVWAVGGYLNNSMIGNTLTEHWNGTQWSVVKSPNP